MRQALPLATALFLGCATLPPGGAQSQTVRVDLDGARVFIEYGPSDAAWASRITGILPAAMDRLRTWGSFDAPVTILIRPDHEALEDAIGRHDYPWLRAWATYDSIDLQSPRTWRAGGANVEQVTELLSHELTHCLMYQLSGHADDWAFKDIPMWFREGMASYTSGQGYRRPTDEQLASWLAAHRGVDPVADADGIYQTEPEAVYGAAHRAFEFLDDRYGAKAIRDTMLLMRNGAGFGPAFRSATGLSADAFAREFIRSLRWEGWRDAPNQ